MHEDLIRAINDTNEDPKNIPLWFTSGITFLLPKDPKKLSPNYLPPHNIFL